MAELSDYICMVCEAGSTVEVRPYQKMSPQKYSSPQKPWEPDSNGEIVVRSPAITGKLNGINLNGADPNDRREAVDEIVARTKPPFYGKYFTVGGKRSPEYDFVDEVKKTIKELEEQASDPEEERKRKFNLKEALQRLNYDAQDKNYKLSPIRTRQLRRTSP